MHAQRMRQYRKNDESSAKCLVRLAKDRTRRALLLNPNIESAEHREARLATDKERKALLLKPNIESAEHREARLHKKKKKERSRRRDALERKRLHDIKPQVDQSSQNKPMSYDDAAELAPDCSERPCTHAHRLSQIQPSDADFCPKRAKLSIATNKSPTFEETSIDRTQVWKSIDSVFWAY